MMNMEHRLTQHQTQRLMMSPQMQQAIQILQYSNMELDQYVKQELDSNPVLEVVRTDPKAEPLAPTEPVVSDTQETFESPEFQIDDYPDSWSREGRDLSVNREADDRRDYYQNSITKEESFVSRLLTQLRLSAPNQAVYRIGERIIGDIDGRGYFAGSLEEIAQELSVDLREVERALYLIQRFEPLGVGARDIVECLLIQIAAEYPHEDELRVLVERHLSDLERRQIPKIAKAMRITPERVEELRTMLSRLDPFPGLEFDGAPTQYVTPDVIVEWDDELNDYDVYLANDSLPELRINRGYRNMAKQASPGSEERKYFREKMESAKWLIRNIRQRQQTIQRVARAIVEVQRGFLDKGPEYIKPLTLQEIADRVGIHEATVSRTTRGKYVQTPQGLFEMKYFFSPGLTTDRGGAQSSKSVQSLIEKLVDEEDKRRPLSDQAIANKLREQGIQIARRTVTKYREGLGVLPTNLRREYQD